MSRENLSRPIPPARLYCIGCNQPTIRFIDGQWEEFCPNCDTRQEETFRVGWDESD